MDAAATRMVVDDLVRAVHSGDSLAVDSVLIRLYEVSGGDVNRSGEDSSRRNVLLELHDNVVSQTLLGLFRTHGFGLKTKSLVMAVMRNLGREQRGNDFLFASQLVIRDLVPLLNGRAMLSQDFVANAFGLIWSQVHRKTQGNWILQRIPSLARVVFDLTKLHSTDTLVLRSGFGLLNALAALRLDSVFQTITPQLLSRLFASLSSSHSSPAHRDLEALDSLISCVARLPLTHGYSSILMPNFFVKLLDEVRDTKPKLATNLLVVVDRISESNSSTITTPLRVLMCRYFDQTQDNSRRDLALKIINRTIKTENFASLPALVGLESLAFADMPILRDISATTAASVEEEFLVSAVNARGNRLLVAELDGSRMFCSEQMRMKELTRMRGNTVSMWDISSSDESQGRRRIWRLYSESGTLRDITSLTFNAHDASRCLLGTARGDLFILNCENGSVLATHKPENRTDEIWFVSFVGRDMACYGQGGACFVFDFRTRSTTELLSESHRLQAFQATLEETCFVSVEYTRANPDDADYSNSRCCAFRLRRILGGFEVVGNVADLVVASDDQPTMISAIGICSKFAVVSTSGSNGATLFSIAQGIPLVKLENIFSLSRSVESCWISSTGSRILFVASSSNSLANPALTEFCLYETGGSGVVSRFRVPNQVSSCCTSNDCSLAFVQLNASNVIRMDFKRDMRDRILALGQAMPSASGDVLRRIKQLLI